MLDSLAPGAMITGADASGGTHTMLGTSQAAPHVSGLAALAQQLAQRELGRRITVTEFRNLLNVSGMQVFDGDDEDDNVTNLNTSFSRIDTLSFAENLLQLDSMPPVEPPILPGTPAGNENAEVNRTAQEYAYTVEVLSGDHIGGLDFGNYQNLAPTVDDQIFDIDENSMAGSIVDQIFAQDPNIGDELIYDIISGNKDANNNDIFSIDDSGNLQVLNNHALDFETNETLNLIIRVTDQGNPP